MNNEVKLILNNDKELTSTAIFDIDKNCALKSMSIRSPNLILSYIVSEYQLINNSFYLPKKGHKIIEQGDEYAKVEMKVLDVKINNNVNESIFDNFPFPIGCAIKFVDDGVTYIKKQNNELVNIKEIQKNLKKGEVMKIPANVDLKLENHPSYFNEIFASSLFSMGSG